jgi:VanZ family protein
MTFLKHLYWALLWALVILVLCLLPGKDVPSFWWTQVLSIDKFVHAGVFFVLVILIVRGLRRRDPDLALRSRTTARWLAACIAYGGVLEIMQGVFLTDRYADILDFLANALGCGLAWWWMRRRETVATPA